MIKNIGYIAKLLMLLFSGTALFSCISTRSLTLEIPEKPRKELPGNIQSLLIISRVSNEKYNDLDTDSLQWIFYRQNFDYDTVINDIGAIDTTLKAIGDLLYESGRFDIVIPEDRFQENKNSLAIARELTQTEVRTLCDTFKTDGVLSIDYFKTRVMTSFDKMVDFDPYANNYADFVKAEMKVNYEVLFRIYDPLKQNSIVRRILMDTLSWEGADRTATDLFYRFTPVKNALYEAGITAAIDFAGEISPVWRTESRRIYISGDDFLKKAAILVDSNRWEEAIKLWKNSLETAKSASVKSKTEFNLAVAYEIAGDVDAAIEWALKSYETMFRTITYDYLEILKNRKTELQKYKP